MSKDLFDKLAEVASSLLMGVEKKSQVSRKRRSSKRTDNPPRKRTKQEESLNIRVRSFAVPEIELNISESATVGALKRAVMDRVAGCALKVGVLVGNSKVSDETSLSELRKSVSDLGFMLEPAVLPSTDPVTVLLQPQPTDDNVPNLQTDMQKQSGDLVPVDPNVLDNAGKRRLRISFTVPEVEALVAAVEQLGTGRWRDIKMHAFANSNHRSYVDLKDKWKTLVHTAQIAPHQRRGMPVPEPLLQRVTNANNYWTVLQAKEREAQA